MTINEAIRVLSDIANEYWDTDVEVKADACQLGIEALKHHKKLRDTHPYSNYKILPGETED